VKARSKLSTAQSVNMHIAIKALFYLLIKDRKSTTNNIYLYFQHFVQRMSQDESNQKMGVGLIVNSFIIEL